MSYMVTMCSDDIGSKALKDFFDTIKGLKELGFEVDDHDSRYYTSENTNGNDNYPTSIIVLRHKIYNDYIYMSGDIGNQVADLWVSDDNEKEVHEDIIWYTNLIMSTEEYNAYRKDLLDDYAE